MADFNNTISELHVLCWTHAGCVFTRDHFTGTPLEVKTKLIDTLKMLQPRAHSRRYGFKGNEGTPPSDTPLFEHDPELAEDLFYEMIERESTKDELYDFHYVRLGGTQPKASFKSYKALVKAVKALQDLYPHDFDEHNFDGEPEQG